MKKTIHVAASRGHASHGWLQSAHSFSFAGYYDAARMQFGALRVLNDDIIDGGRGFAPHRHANMEIVSIPLRGGLVHGDDQGHQEVVYPNDVQVMSAGSGIVHSEYNASATERGSFLQLWIFPEQQEVAPRYAQQSFDPALWKNQIAHLVTAQGQGGALWIQQQAVIARASLEPGCEVVYALQSAGHGLYIFVIEGQVEVGGEVLVRRDAMGITEAREVALRGVELCDVLLVEVPMAGVWL